VAYREDGAFLKNLDSKVKRYLYYDIKISFLLFSLIENIFDKFLFIIHTDVKLLFLFLKF
jgi:hypothetical protein